MNVVEFPLPNLNDMVALVRRLADDLEAGNYGNAVAFAGILETDEGMNLFGFGEADAVRSIALFNIGNSVLVSGIVGNE